MELLGLIVGGTIMVVLAASRRCRIWISIIIGTVIIGVIAGFNILTLGKTMLAGALSRDSLELFALALFAIYLGKLMSELGLLTKLRHTLDHTVGNPMVPIASIPALIGCLPVAGGAIMSAPLVHVLATEQKIPPARGAAINQVFRHAIPMVLPFSPALALGARLIDMPLLTLVALLVPLSVVTIITGLTLLRGEQTIVISPHHLDWTGIYEILKMSSPIWLALLAAILLPYPVYVALIIGIITAIVLGKTTSGLLRMFIQSLDGEILLAIPAAVGLRAVLLTSGALEAASTVLTASGIPLFLIAIILPALVAGMSGNLMTHIVVTFPLLVGMAPPDARPAYAVLVYMSGFIAYFASPLHLCQIASLRCFGCTARELYHEYVVVVPTLIAASLALFALLLYIKPAIYT